MSRSADEAAVVQREFDLALGSTRELNHALQQANASGTSQTWHVRNPGGAHTLAVGLDAPTIVEIDGHVGYYCAGMNKYAAVTVNGNAGPGVAENMMSGMVRVRGNASQYAGASAHGGLLIVEGSASSRCGISMKGVDIVVRGSVGHLSAFMAQSGRLVVCGDAGDALGDSIYEARLYVRGNVAGLGADCVEKPMKDKHKREVEGLLNESGISGVDGAEFSRFGSARTLYHFDVDRADAY